jgi:hypothetical protein
MPITELDVSDEIIEALEPLQNVGEIMWRFLIDEGALRRLLGKLPDTSFAQLHAALDQIVIPEIDEVSEPEIVAEESAEIVAEAEVVIEDVVEAPVVEEVIEVEIAPSAFGDEVLPPAKDAELETGKVDTKPKTKPREDRFDEVEETEEEGDLDVLLTGDKEEVKKKKKDRQRRRQLVFDEELGEVVSKRRRKGGRSRDDWDDFLD